MKKIILPSVVAFELSALVAVGCATFLGPCVHEDGSVAACHWTGLMLSGIGALLALTTLMSAFLPSARGGLLLGAILAAVLGILAPGRLLPLCGMTTMRCRALMRPASAILFALIAICALIGFLMDRRKEHR